MGGIGEKGVSKTTVGGISEERGERLTENNSVRAELIGGNKIQMITCRRGNEKQKK